MLLIAQIVFFVVTTLVAYVYWLRPILRSRPQLKAFYAQTDSFWTALRLRFAGLKTQLLAGVSMAATGIVALHDFILTNAFGIDWTPVRDLLPPWPRSSCSPTSGSSPSFADDRPMAEGGAVTCGPGLASLLGGPGINGLIGAYKAKLEAANTEGAQAADLAVTAIAAEIEVRKSAQAIIIAEQGRWWTALPRAIVQWSFAVFVAKCVVWDMVLGWARPSRSAVTSPPGPAGSWRVVCGRSLEKIATTIWGRR